MLGSLHLHLLKIFRSVLTLRGLTSLSLRSPPIPDLIGEQGGEICIKETIGAYEARIGWKTRSLRFTSYARRFWKPFKLHIILLLKLLPCLRAFTPPPKS